MTKDELEKWVINELWPVYKQLCKTPYPTKYDGGVRGECIKAVQKLNPSTELREQMLQAVNSQIIHRQKLYQQLGSKQKYEAYTKGNSIYLNRHGKTWVNNRGWTDEIPSISEIKDDESVATELCRWEDCQEPAKTPTGHCAWHWTKVHCPEALDKHREWLKEHGLAKRKDETREEWVERCRAYFKDYFKPLAKSMGVNV